MLRIIKDLLKPLASTPLHPQWFTTLHRKRISDWLKDETRGPVVLDIGCGERWAKALLPESCRYLGLDYPETAAWYKTRPDVFANAQDLPFARQSIDTVLMLDVVEHLPHPRRALSEAHRCLKENGTLILFVPFLYPIHDAPHDYGRWSLYGLRRLVTEQGFAVEKEAYSGNPLETAALLSNIAMTKSVFNWISHRQIASLLVLFLPLHILLNNLWAWFLSRFGPGDDMMPIGYQMVLKAKASASAPIVEHRQGLEQPPLR
jgi:SAM-dependent methyltransferase